MGSPFKHFFLLNLSLWIGELSFFFFFPLNIRIVFGSLVNLEEKHFNEQKDNESANTRRWNTDGEESMMSAD